jgi:hypothetical protein
LTKAPTHYFDESSLEKAVMSGGHRHIVGGLWHEMGRLQLDFLCSQGLLPYHKIVDIGCGCLRAGVPLVRYLDAGNYFGTDISAALLRAGYEIELTNAGTTTRLPRGNLVEVGDFDFSWSPVQFDFALAQSVFTHLTIDYLRRCLIRLNSVVKPGSSILPLSLRYL